MKYLSTLEEKFRISAQPCNCYDQRNDTEHKHNSMTLMAASKDHEVWLQNNKSRDTEMHANLCSITTSSIFFK